MRLILLLSLPFYVSVDSAIAKPNSVIVLADDMGYGDIQALNPDLTIPTLHLNSLALLGRSLRMLILLRPFVLRRDTVC